MLINKHTHKTNNQKTSKHKIIMEEGIVMGPLLILFLQLFKEKYNFRMQNCIFFVEFRYFSSQK